MASLPSPTTDENLLCCQSRKDNTYIILFLHSATKSVCTCIYLHAYRSKGAVKNMFQRQYSPSAKIVAQIDGRARRDGWSGCACAEPLGSTITS